MGLRVKILPAARMFVSCECCVFFGRVLFDGPVPPEESYRVSVCVCVCVCVYSDTSANE